MHSSLHSSCRSRSVSSSQCTESNSTLTNVSGRTENLDYSTYFLVANVDGNFQELVLEVSDSKPAQSNAKPGEESTLSKAGIHPFTYKITSRSQQQPKQPQVEGSASIVPESGVSVLDVTFSQTHDAFLASNSKSGEVFLSNPESGKRQRYRLARLGRILKLEDSDRDNSLFYLSRWPVTLSQTLFRFAVTW